MKLPVVTIIMIIDLSSRFPVFAAELQSQKLCAEQAEHVFETAGFDSDQMATYINHFDEGANKCFVLLHFLRVDNEGISVFKSVVDAFEGTEYASYEKHIDVKQDVLRVKPMVCKVTPIHGEEIDCSSVDEFNQLLKDKFGITTNNLWPE